MESTKEEYKALLNKLKATGDAPEWLTWMGYQTLCGGYLLHNETPKMMYERVAVSAANYLPNRVDEYRLKFFDVMWKGYLAPSTPVLCNMGTHRGQSVSCSGNYVSDDLFEIYGCLQENAMLTKAGFGTSSAMPLRGLGSPLSKGGTSSGLWSWIEQYHAMTQKVSQGGVRRGSWAGYFDVEHSELQHILHKYVNTDKMNLGINVTNSFIAKLKDNDKDAMNTYRLLLETRMVKGRPYLYFIDRVNTLAPDTFGGMKIQASNLCNEVALPSDKEHTFSCVLSSMNGAKFEEWKDTDAVQTATVFLDCVAEDLIVRGSVAPGLHKVVKFTQKSRALGLGLLGFHTHLQSKNIAFNSLPAQFENDIVFKHLHDESLKASQFLASWLGEPEWCVGKGVRNSTRMAIAPNTSSAIICGSTSQGIEPWVANYYIQKTAKGKFDRINPLFRELLDKHNQLNQSVLDSVALNKGSCQHLTFLSDEEKDIFKTAYEISQFQIIHLAERRQKYIDQGQSLNLFFSDTEDENYIHEVHKKAFESEWIKGLYYVRSMAGINADKGDECVSCEG